MPFMNWTETRVKNVTQELAEENPLACRGLLSIADIIFTEGIPTMAVSLTSPPVLKINLSFLNEHAQSDNDVKAVLMHEFLHVLLKHTEQYELNNPILNIALDAIINAIIHRTMGREYSDFFSRFYRKKGFLVLLQHMESADFTDDFMAHVHHKIYSNQLAADDLYELLRLLTPKIHLKAGACFTPLGNHEVEYETSEFGKELLDAIMRQMDGTQIWSKPKTRGSNERNTNLLQRCQLAQLRDWQTALLQQMQPLFLPDHPAQKRYRRGDLHLPILSHSDRRKLAQGLYTPLLPISRHHINESIRESVTVYLDVSGSMDHAIVALINLLFKFRRQIRTPIWGFSNSVFPATFKGGKLDYKTTFGTEIKCVIDHIVEHRITKCLIITDGYFSENLTSMLEGISPLVMHAIIAPEGDPSPFEKAQIPFTILKKLPNAIHS
ncbi:MAG: hypothetical protein RLZZ248_724 [Bacteroidota bacterium]